VATAHPGSLIEAKESHSLSIARLAVTTGITAAVIFVLCWLGTFVAFSSPTHAYITLFTTADISSALALVGGTCWSLLFGLIVGAVFAFIYNASAPLARR
jgi:hypothetical protein